MRTAIVLTALFVAACASWAQEPALDAPKAVPRFDFAEFTLRLETSPFQNPFTEADVSGEFTPPGGKPIHVFGFADSEDGRLFRLRFSPPQGGVTYKYTLRLRGAGVNHRFTGELRSDVSSQAGPVIVDPVHPKHFLHAGSGKHFYHLGYTAYHLLDSSKSEEEIDATIDYCARRGFNKIRFLLTGYPRDHDGRTSADVEHGVPDARKAINYGSQRSPCPPGRGSRTLMTSPDSTLRTGREWTARFAGCASEGLSRRRS